MERRNTMQKELTYDAVMSYPGHPSADDIYRVIASEYSTISKATVYRNLSLLADEGKIGRVESFASGGIHYDKRLDRHFHGHCIKCGKVVDIAVSYDKEPSFKVVSQEDGFDIISHEVVFVGTCRECREKEKENGTEGIKD